MLTDYFYTYSYNVPTKIAKPSVSQACISAAEFNSGFTINLHSATF